MGILANAISIVIGGLSGSFIGTKISKSVNKVVAIAVMLISFVGIIENLFIVKEGAITSTSLYLVTAVFVIGTLIGEWLKIEERMSNLASTDKPFLNGIIDSSVFFGIGGLQISGSILLAVNGDSSLLYLKSMIDLPLSLMFGAVYGRVVALSSIPVALIQLLIAAIAYLFGDLISSDMIRDLSAIGYIILFFSGFNLICEPKFKIKNSNMIPAILLLIIYYLLLTVGEI